MAGWPQRFPLDSFHWMDVSSGFVLISLSHPQKMTRHGQKKKKSIILSTGEKSAPLMSSSLAGSSGSRGLLHFGPQVKTHLTVQGVRYRSHPPGAPSQAGERGTHNVPTYCAVERGHWVLRKRRGGPPRAPQEDSRSRTVQARHVRSEHRAELQRVKCGRGTKLQWSLRD